MPKKSHDPTRKARETGPPPGQPRRVDPPRAEEVPEWLKLSFEQPLPQPAVGDEYLSSAAADRLRGLLLERAKRRAEALHLYEPLPIQAAFHASKARMAICRGSNRSGKTLAAAVEVARAVTGQDPFGKYPKENGRCFCVGKDLRHVGDVMWRKLSRAGAFKMIRDQGTGVWRAYRPWSTVDAARAHEAKDAPPLIPPRLIKKIAWELKAENIPALVTLTTGWELSFFSSLGKPPQGSDISLYWLDEEVVDEEWVPELSARILDRRGRGLWSATPQAGTDQLYELHEVAERERGEPNPSVEEFVALLSDNPHFAEADKLAYAATLGEEDLQVRVGGEFALIAQKIYPEFNMFRHGEDYREIPASWTRYAAIDPGHQVCAVLFAAVPPPQECGSQVWLIDELYLRRCDAATFGEEFKRKVANQPQFHAFVIDPNMCKFTEMGIGRSVGEQYSDALRERGIRCTTTGSYFSLGCDDVKAGILAVHGMMRARADGSIRLRVLRGMLPNFEYEVKRYHNKRVKGVLVDAPENRKASHTLDCLRYLALYDPAWVKPVAPKPKLGGAAKAFRDKQKRRAGRDGGPYIRLGPGKPKGAY